MAEDGLNLSCSICLDPFKMPKVLSCGHTYCLPCVNQLVNRRGYLPTLQCPTCRRNVDFPESGRTEDLITNFQLQALVDQQNEKLSSGGSSNRKRARVRGHSECNIHKIENELYCQSCKVPICTKCTLSEHDVGEHNIITKSKFIREQKKTYEELSKELPNIQSIHLRLREECKLRMKLLLEEKREMQGKIQQTLERKQNELLQSARELQQQLGKSCSAEEGDEFLVKLLLQQDLFERVQNDSENIKAELDAEKLTTKMEAFSENLRKVTSELVTLANSIEALPYMSNLVYDGPNATPTDVGSLKQNPEMGNMERHYKAVFLIDDATQVHMKI